MDPKTKEGLAYLKKAYTAKKNGNIDLANESYKKAITFF